MKWTIGILTVPQRKAQLKELLDVLKPQVKNIPEVEIIIHRNNGGSLGALRQRILDDALGEYISFIDDDDLVVEDYVRTILPLLDGVDYVGFKVAFYEDEVKQKPVVHSLDYKDWFDNDFGYYRDIEPKNPIKTSFMREVNFRGNWDADRLMAEDLRDKLKTQHFIDREMYIYQHSTKGSLI